MKNEVGWMNQVLDSSEDGESFIEIQINKPAAGSSISSSQSPENGMQTTTILSSASTCFSAYSSLTRLMMKLGCLSIVGVIREKVNVGEKWVLQVIHRRRNKSLLRYYCEGSTNYNEEALTEDSLKAAIAYCNASSHSPLRT
ncbi:hypothetical protein CARUB_v10012724mg [Capsella rubella]|uniref:Uncharacterized protein n=1 Tax=Capsella rubella TaxID=81985 RepID=R0ET53_9BRAS|nr:uncharacterized protein LOC17874464 [Capsella rubella]EOA12237.1 hypothetical protein CARUB_v10012724mg [Capsella rubella]